MSDRLAPPRTLPIEQGGTNARTREGARENLDVPSLSGANTLTGANRLTNNLTVDGTTTLNGTVNASGTVNLTGAASNHQIAGSLIVAGSEEVGGTLNVTGEVGFSANVTANAALSVVGKSFLVGGLAVAYVAKTANYTLTAADCIVNATSGSWTATLPTAVGVAGQVYVIKNSGAGTITLATTSSQTIDGGAPGTVAAGAVVRLVSDGANWVTI